MPEEPAVTDEPRWRCPPRLVAASEVTLRLAIVAAGVLAVGWLALYLSVVTVPAFVALLVAAVLEPLVRRLRDRRWPSLLATWTVLLGAVAVVAAVVTALTGPVGDELGDLGEQVDEGIAEIEEWLETGPLGIEDPDLQDAVEIVGDRLVESGPEPVVAGATALGELVAGTLLALVMTFFFLKDGPRIVAALVALVPESRRGDVARAGAAAWSTLAAYVRGTAVVGLVNGTVVGIGLAVIGVPLVLPLAVLTAISAFFPLVGAVVAGAVAALVALVAEGPGAALAVVALVVVVQQVEGDVLSPVVMGRALALHPLVILVALTVGAVVAGILGAFLAVPVVAVAVAVRNAVVAPAGGPADDEASPASSG